jgi:16S rRNA (cytidine1402-2'-O)-methyltransferase
LETQEEIRILVVTPMAGLLYIVATPIGNLEDITHRAVRILGEVDQIACEDTRHVRKLLDHYGISRPLISYHDHNEAARTDELIEELQQGRNVALVTDAGTPLVSDPGYRLVSRAVKEGIQVIPIPGPAAAITALMGAGLPTDSFHFGGFLPIKRQQRRKTLESLRSETATLVFYEAPHRILDSLDDIQAVLGPRAVVLARELTKIHEEFLRGTADEVRAELANRPALKGEMTVLIGRAAEVEPDDRPLPDAVNALITEGLSRMDAIKTVARRRGLGKRDVYQALQQDK